MNSGLYIITHTDRLIKGYLELSQAEIDLMKRTKEQGPVLEQLAEKASGIGTIECSVPMPHTFAAIDGLTM